MHSDRDHITPPSQAEIERIKRIYHAIADKQVVLGAQNILDVLVVEHRLKVERMAARRVLVATWVLVLVTAALVAATVALVAVTPS